MPAPISCGSSCRGRSRLSDALNPPRSPPRRRVSGNQARNIWAERFANRTTVQLDAGQVDVDSWVIHKQLYHPIFQVLDQDGLTWGLAPRWTGSFTVGGLANDLVVGGRYFAGTNDALQYVNNRGSRGAQTANGVQRAQNYEAFAENRLWVLPQVALVAGAKALRDERDYENRLTGQRFSRTYDGLNPKLGVLWQPRPEVQVFANITRSQDVPDFSDLLQTVNNQPVWVPMQAQRAWTVELGTRGRFDARRLGPDAVPPNLRGQLLQYTVDPIASRPAPSMPATR